MKTPGKGRHAIVAQLTMEVPAVETTVARNTQRAAIIGAFDRLNELLARQLRAVAVNLVTERHTGEEPSAAEEKNYPQPKQPIRCNPEHWECDVCGGKLMAETVGMFAGRRWIHTCPGEGEAEIA